jgi:hypothetical protein
MKFLLGGYKLVLAWDVNMYESHQYKTNTCGKLVSMCEKTTFQTSSRHLNVDELACTYIEVKIIRTIICVGMMY